MDSLHHTATKLPFLPSQTTTATPTPPPAYTSTLPIALPLETDADLDDPPTTMLHLNASTQIRGSHNLVSVAPLDVPRFSALLLSVLRQQPRQGRGNLNLHLNCSVTVVGERNVVGPGLSVGVRAGAAAAGTAGTARTSSQRTATGQTMGPAPWAAPGDAESREGVVRSAKRRPNEEPEDGPAAKKVEVTSPSCGCGRK